MPEILPFNDPERPIEFKRSDVPLKVRSFPLHRVRLLAGPYHDAQEWNRGYMARLPVDRVARATRPSGAIPKSSSLASE